MLAPSAFSQTDQSTSCPRRFSSIWTADLQKVPALVPVLTFHEIYSVVDEFEPPGRNPDEVPSRARQSLQGHLAAFRHVDP